MSSERREKWPPRDGIRMMYACNLHKTSATTNVDRFVSEKFESKKNMRPTFTKCYHLTFDWRLSELIDPRGVTSLIYWTIWYGRQVHECVFVVKAHCFLTSLIRFPFSHHHHLQGHGGSILTQFFFVEQFPLPAWTIVCRRSWSYVTFVYQVGQLFDWQM